MGYSSQSLSAERRSSVNAIIGTESNAVESDDRIKGLGGCAVLAALLVGVFAVIGAANGAAQRNWEAAGICLIASAISFVGVAQVIFRR
jgi:hypothetical protein